MKWTTGEVTRDPRFFTLLGLEAERHDIVGLFWYGYPDEVPAASRRDASEFIISLP